MRKKSNHHSFMTSFGLAPFPLTMQIMYFPIICGTLGFPKTFLLLPFPGVSCCQRHGLLPAKGFGKVKECQGWSYFCGHQIPPLFPLSQIRKQTQRKWEVCPSSCRKGPGFWRSTSARCSLHGATWCVEDSLAAGQFVHMYFAHRGQQSKVEDMDC